MLVLAAAASIVAQVPATPATVQSQTSDPARRIAEATFQPDKVRAAALANFSEQFDAGSQRTANGRAFTPAQRVVVARGRAAGLASMKRQLDQDVIPTVLGAIERDYRDNYSLAELDEAAAFWTSPAGLALTADMQAKSLSGGTISPPAEHSNAVAGYFASAVGQKEASRRSVSQREINEIMSRAMARVREETFAAIQAATIASPVSGTARR